MDAREWLRRVTDNASVNAVAGQIDMGQRTLNDQISGASTFRPETAVKIARAYGYSPVTALVDLGLITAMEARDKAKLRAMNLADALTGAEDADLLREIGNRLHKRAPKGVSDPAATVPKRMVAKRSSEEAGASEDDGA